MMDRITIPQIRILVAVARENNFSRAAKALGISQPAVSVQLRELQKKYGVKIYTRRGKQIILSDLGMDLVNTGRKVLGLIDEMDIWLKEAGNLVSGKIHVGLSCHYFVKDLLGKFMKDFPGVRVKASIGHSAGLLEEISACRMDVAEITAIEKDPKLYYQKYSEQNILMFVSKTHPWARKKKIDITALHNEKMVALHGKSMTRQIFNKKLAEKGVKPDIVLELDNWDTMKEVVAAGVGFGIALEDEFGPDERLLRVSLKGSDFKAYQYFVCHPEYKDFKTVSAFLDIVSKESEKLRIRKQLKQYE